MAQAAPKGMQFLIGSGFIVSGVVVIALNLLFRLGSSQRERHELDAPEATARLQLCVTEFVQEQGAAWGARREVVQRACLAALEGAETIVAAGERKVMAISGSFDEFNLDIVIEHSGAALALPAPVGSATLAHPADLLDADDAAFEAALQSLSAVLLRRLADRVTTSPATAGKPASLRLHFDH
jgi:hypothetical protein